MRASLRLAGVGLLCSLASPAVLADEGEADTCLRTLIWDGYAEGWAVRTAMSSTLGPGEHRVYVLSLFSGNEYKLQVCADGNATDVDLVLHDKDGNEVARDSSDGPRPSLTHKAETTASYYVAVHAASLAEGAEKTGVAMAVVYR